MKEITHPMSAPDSRKSRYRQHTLIIALIAVLIGMGELHAGAFLTGRIAGFYWVSMAWRRIPWLLALSSVMLAVTLIVGVVLRKIGIIRVGANAPTVLERVGRGLALLVLTGVLLVPPFASGPLIGTGWKHSDSIKIENHAYHLAIYNSFFHDQLVVFECGPAGIVCHKYSQHDGFSAGRCTLGRRAERLTIQCGNDTINVPTS